MKRQRRGQTAPPTSVTSRAEQTYLQALHIEARYFPSNEPFQSSAEVMSLKAELTRQVLSWAASMSLAIVNMEVFYNKSGPYITPYHCHAILRAVDGDLDEVFAARLFTETNRDPAVSVYLLGAPDRKIIDDAGLGAAFEDRKNNSTGMIYGD